MKRILLLTVMGLLFIVPAFGFDADQLRGNGFMVGSFLQSVVNQQNRGNIPQANILYLEGFGTIMSYTTYFNRDNGQPKIEFNKNNERLVKGLALFLSTLPGLKENEKVVVSISDTNNNPYATYTAQVATKDLLMFQAGKIKLEELQKKIRFTDSLFIEK